MKVQSATHTLYWLELVIDGKPAWVNTRWSLLQAGVVVLLDPEGATPHWRVATTAEATPDPDAPEQRFEIAGGTKDPVVLALARRYYAAKNSDDFEPGPVSIPAK